MNNNYRESILAVFLIQKNQTSYSVWSCGVPFFHPCFRFFTVPVIIVSGSEGIFSDDSGDAHNVGNKLGETFEATRSKVQRWRVSITTATSEMHQCHRRLYFNSSI